MSSLIDQVALIILWALVPVLIGEIGRAHV
jgi:hypothetical protein